MSQGISNSCEAIFIACETEKRSVQFFERALSLSLKDEMHILCRTILEQERNHVSILCNLLSGTEYDEGHCASLSQQSIELIFSGGLMKAHRIKAFSSVARLLSYVIEQKHAMIQLYAQSLSFFEGKQALIVRSIIQEEMCHYDALVTQQGD